MISKETTVPIGVSSLSHSRLPVVGKLLPIGSSGSFNILMLTPAFVFLAVHDTSAVLPWTTLVGLTVIDTDAPSLHSLGNKANMASLGVVGCGSGVRVPSRADSLNGVGAAPDPNTNPYSVGGLESPVSLSLPSAVGVTPGVLVMVDCDP